MRIPFLIFLLKIFKKGEFYMLTKIQVSGTIKGEIDMMEAIKLKKKKKASKKFRSKIEIEKKLR
jgi:hypothetical protein